MWVCGLHGLNKPPGMQLNRTVTFFNNFENKHLTAEKQQGEKSKIF